MREKALPAWGRKGRAFVPFKNLKALADSLGVNISAFFSEDKSSPVDSIDIRWIKKFQDIQSLSEAEKKELNQHINSLDEKARLRQNQASK